MREGEDDPGGYLRSYLPLGHLQSLARFRLCVWPLEVNRRNGRVREVRVCQFCATGRVEDELHVALECGAYADLRVKYGISDDVEDMRKMFLRTSPRTLGAYFHEVLNRRQQRALEPHRS